MNILHITPDFNYACGRSYYVFLLLKYLRNAGHSVHLVTNGGDSLERANELDIPVHIIKSLNNKNPLSIARTIKQLKVILQENDIDLVHSHHRYSELVTIQAKKLIRTKRILTVHTALSIVDKRYHVEYKSDKIIAVSNSIFKMLTERFGVNRSRIERIPNFVDTDEISGQRKFKRIANRHGKHYNILAVGRFHHEKNFDTLLHALHRLRNPGIRTILIGEGDRHIDYKGYISKNKLNVEIYAPQRDLTGYFQRADVCVLPSIRDPFPNFMLQSGLYRKPFIGANIDGISELITHRKNGLLFDSGDTAGLAERIELFRSNRSLASSCANELNSNVMKNFTQYKIVPRIELLYNHLVND